MLSTINALAVYMTKLNPIDSSDQIMFVSMLQIWNLRYFMHFFYYRPILQLLKFLVILTMCFYRLYF